ncbi:hypothetical protein B0T18DRAFT_454255 [Schizothecium vesticola]|uniref:Heterokaryon incompatibility domain-containing protein n=1 Tax=Schizothecium vesticola TaxID=314040 RepID=A0AA40KD17_9PEZI|nr:hypothetical protein B0T18DRAFT_454255 [Schizothecium vesticola]
MKFTSSVAFLGAVATTYAQILVPTGPVRGPNTLVFKQINGVPNNECLTFTNDGTMVNAACALTYADRQDWRRQGQVMDKIYQRALITICVAAGQGSNSGIPGARERCGDLLLTGMRPVASLIRDSMWDSRAWTFQERLLSTRCAIFTPAGIVWQCSTITWREDMASQFDRTLWSLDSVGSPLRALIGNPLRSYSSCVNISSSRKLTYLVVLGLKLDSEFIFGLPSRYFDWALLWETETSVDWRLSIVGGPLFNLHEWLTERTWIIWRVPEIELDCVREWTPETPKEGQLLFKTFTGFFTLSRKSMSKSAFQSTLAPGLFRFGITDSSGDWCCSVILDKTWKNSVGAIFEFAAISDAKGFTITELDTWTYYIPEERQQAEWYCFNAIMLQWQVGLDGEPLSVAERVGLAKIFQSSFFGRSFKPYEWKRIVLR